MQHAVVGIADRWRWLRGAPSANSADIWSIFSSRHDSIGCLLSFPVRFIEKIRLFRPEGRTDPVTRWLSPLSRATRISSERIAFPGGFFCRRRIFSFSFFLVLFCVAAVWFVGGRWWNQSGQKWNSLGADWNNLNSCAFVAIYRLAYRNLRNLRFRLIFSFLCCLWSVACIFWFQLICWRFKWADLHIIVPWATNERVECHTVASVSDD